MNEEDYIEMMCLINTLEVKVARLENLLAFFTDCDDLGTEEPYNLVIDTEPKRPKLELVKND